MKSALMLKMRSPTADLTNGVPVIYKTVIEFRRTPLPVSSSQPLCFLKTMFGIFQQATSKILFTTAGISGTNAAGAVSSSQRTLGKSV